MKWVVGPDLPFHEGGKVSRKEYIFREQNCYRFFPFFYKTSLKILEKCTENGLIKKLHPWHWQQSAQLGIIISEIAVLLCFNKYFLSTMIIQVNYYEIVLNVFHISHNLTWHSAIVHKFTRIYPVCSTYELTKQFM